MTKHSNHKYSAEWNQTNKTPTTRLEISFVLKFYRVPFNVANRLALSSSGLHANSFVQAAALMSRANLSTNMLVLPHMHINRIIFEDFAKPSYSVSLFSVVSCRIVLANKNSTRVHERRMRETYNQAFVGIEDELERLSENLNWPRPLVCFVLMGANA